MPLGQELTTRQIEIDRERSPGPHKCAFWCASKAESEDAVMSARLGSDRNRATGCRLKRECRCAVAVEILPTVRGSDETTAQGVQRDVGGKTEHIATTLSICCAILDPRVVAMACASQVRCHDGYQAIRTDQRITNEQNIAMRVRQHLKR